MSAKLEPNVALNNARHALAAYREPQDAGDLFDAIETLADAFEALDEWITKGGVLPREWSKPNRKSRK
jgi:hypothetical protein